MEEIKPQEGPQDSFLSSPADIALYGGAAGGGKTFALLLEPLRHIQNSNFGGVIFRRTRPQIRNEGGLWDTSQTLYPYVNAAPKESTLKWIFPSGAKLSFDQLEYEKTVNNWQGSQVAFIGWDELTHFTKKQFLYMLSRNRSTCGVIPYMRATCNPESLSWVRELIDWWIGPDGYPIPERSGVIRWFVVISNKFIWFDSKDKALEKYPEIPPKSFTFIPAKVEDNKKLLDADPSYMANLHALPDYEKAMLKDGNWDVLAGENRIIHAFDHNKHIVEFDRLGHPVYIGLDFNVAPLCGVVTEIAEDTIYVFDEIHLGTQEKSSNTFKASDHILNNWGVCKIAPDSTGNQRRTSSKTTDHQILKDDGHDVLRVLNPFIKDNYNNINRLFSENRIKIHPRCKYLKKYLLGLTWDNEKEFDHIIKALGYLAWKLFPYKPPRKKSRQIM